MKVALSIFTGVSIMFIFALSIYSLDITTLDGKVYKNAKISEANPAGIVVEYQDGVCQIPFTNLPDDIQKKYSYDPAKAQEWTLNKQKASAQWMAQSFEKQKQEQKLTAMKYEDMKKDLEIAQLQAQYTGKQENSDQSNPDVSALDSNDEGTVNNYYGDGDWGGLYPYNNWYWNWQWMHHRTNPYLNHCNGKLYHSPTAGGEHSSGLSHTGGGVHGGGGGFRGK